MTLNNLKLTFKVTNKLYMNVSLADSFINAILVYGHQTWNIYL